MIRIKSVEPLENFRIRLVLTNGKQKTIDLAPFLQGPIFKPLRQSRSLFQTIHVDEELGTIVWDNGADIDPDVLISDRIPAWMEEYNDEVHSSSSHHPILKEPKGPYSAKRRRTKS
ncbi:MAG TPA: DUF2442 domain-containing protein [Bacteroidota bacterium]|nr:DUF2442 domain-containing protein [Bacteroidota bacterium]